MNGYQYTFTGYHQEKVLRVVPTAREFFDGFTLQVEDEEFVLTTSPGYLIKLTLDDLTTLNLTQETTDQIFEMVQTNNTVNGRVPPNTFDYVTGYYPIYIWRLKPLPGSMCTTERIEPADFLPCINGVKVLCDGMFLFWTIGTYLILMDNHNRLVNIFSGYEHLVEYLANYNAKNTDY